MARKKKISRRKYVAKSTKKNVLYMPLVIIVIAAILGWVVGRFVIAGRLHLGQTIIPEMVESK